MKLLRLRVVALILVLFIIIMSSCAGERGILPVQVDGIGTDRQGEKIEDHLEDQQVHSNTGEVELIPRGVFFADPVRTSPSISLMVPNWHTVSLRMGMIPSWLNIWIKTVTTYRSNSLVLPVITGFSGLETTSIFNLARLLRG